MATKRQIVEEIFKLTESEENRKKIKDSLDADYYYMKFLGLNSDYSQAKYSMACDVNKFSGFEYSRALEEIKKAVA